MTGSFDWTRFTLQIYIKASPQQIYYAWATEEGLLSFFRKSLEVHSQQNIRRSSKELIQQGDRYGWTGYNQEGWETGKILEAKEYQLLRFTFSGEVVPVTIEIHSKEDGECLVKLTQENMPNTEQGHIDWHLSCRSGWSFFLVNLKSVLENQCDLRDKREEKEIENLVNQ